MENDNLDVIADNLMALFPLFHKNILKLQDVAPSKEITRPHFDIMFMLNRLGAMPISEAGKKLFISKPHMTILLDKLISEGLVERLPDKEDRRVINIQLTEEGKEYIKDIKERKKTSIKTKLSNLEDDDLGVLSVSLENIKNIISKIDLEERK
ncbi:MAG: MarR family transcriptional regulator [Clostridia bacterium]|nr:MarR family transcriptional regulator [Clostridia bacterium]